MSTKYTGGLGGRGACAGEGGRRSRSIHFKHLQVPGTGLVGVGEGGFAGGGRRTTVGEEKTSVGGGANQIFFIREQ